MRLSTKLAGLLTAVLAGLASTGGAALAASSDQPGGAPQAPAPAAPAAPAPAAPAPMWASVSRDSQGLTFVAYGSSRKAADKNSIAACKAAQPFSNAKTCNVVADYRGA